MRKVVLVTALLLCASSAASYRSAAWQGWNAHVWNTYCELRNEYWIPSPGSHRYKERRGFLTGTGYNRAFVRFAANTRLHGDVIPVESLGVIQFSLQLYPENDPILNGVVGAAIGAFYSEVNITVADIHVFVLPEHQSLKLLEEFKNNESVGFTLMFADGNRREFTIYPSADRTFFVLADMFRTCIKSHRRDW